MNPWKSLFSVVKQTRSLIRKKRLPTSVYENQSNVFLQNLTCTVKLYFLLFQASEMATHKSLVTAVSYSCLFRYLEDHSYITQGPLNRSSFYYVRGRGWENGNICVFYLGLKMCSRNIWMVPWVDSGGA